MRAATTISKRRGDEPEVHYLIGDARETRAEADADLALWLAAPGLVNALLELRAATIAYLYEPEVDRFAAQARIDIAQIAAGMAIRAAGKLP